MQQNLDVDRFRNGDLIPEAKSDKEWVRYGEQGKPCWCYYDNNPSNGAMYGKLYNFYALSDPRSLAPKGWHIPNDVEWSILTDYLGGEKVAGGKLKSRSYWNSPNEGTTNESGFTGLPGGYRFDFGAFGFEGFFGLWWSSTESSTSDAWCRSLDYVGANAKRIHKLKQSGFSVRCVRD